MLLTSYLKAFTADDDVELYIKTFPNPHNQIGAQLKEISAEFERPARVVIDENPLDDEGLLELYRTAHAMVLPTRGEGFNLPAAEALAMALPVITTGYGAQVDFCTRATSTLVNFHFAPSRSHVRSSDSCWMEPDAADLTAKLRILHKRVLAEDPELNAQRQVALNHVRSTYRWENSARSLLASAG
ncbi:glycosyltransferase, partial [Burkholderia contaminans]